MSRLPFSSSHLANPQTLVHMLAQRLQDFIYMPDPDALYVTLGTLVAAMMKGAPAWVVLVGPPSSGKTLYLEMLAHLANPGEIKAHLRDETKKVEIVGSFSTPAALLSGVASKDKTKNANGGLLRLLGKSGMLVMKDFTSMLSRDPAHGAAIKAMREIFDGRWRRDMGTDGGKAMEWTGKIGFLAASTSAIDRYPEVIGELGERWIYYRFPDSDGYGETIKALSHGDDLSVMEELRGMVANFVASSDLTWSEEGMPRRELASYESNRLYHIASLACAARSTVQRDARTREVMDVTQREKPMRMSKSLGQLLVAFEFLELDEKHRWDLLCKMAIDSIRMTRQVVVKELIKAGMKPVKKARLREITGCGERTVGELMEDLVLLRVAENVKASSDRMGGSGGLKLTEWANKKWINGYKGIVLDNFEDVSD